MEKRQKTPRSENQQQSLPSRACGLIAERKKMGGMVFGTDLPSSTAAQPQMH